MSWLTRINTFSPSRNKFIYSILIEFLASGRHKLFEGIFHCGFVGEGFLLDEVVHMLEKVVVGRRQVRRIWRLRQSFVAQLNQFSERDL